MLKTLTSLDVRPGEGHFEHLDPATQHHIRRPFDVATVWITFETDGKAEERDPRVWVMKTDRGLRFSPRP